MLRLQKKKLGAFDAWTFYLPRQQSKALATVTKPEATLSGMARHVIRNSVRDTMSDAVHATS